MKLKSTAWGPKGVYQEVGGRQGGWELTRILDPEPELGGRFVGQLRPKKVSSGHGEGRA